MSRAAGSDVDGTRVSDYDYLLPEEAIARYPTERRDESRLMVLPPSGGIEHQIFRDLIEWISPGDLLVVNESRVLPARLLGHRAGGGDGEILLLRPVDGSEDEPRVWEAMARPGRRLREGKTLHIAPGFDIHVERVLADGLREVRLKSEQPVMAALEEHGHIPLPPYLDREDEALDRERYQTVYARAAGSVAAPTAGLHFTRDLLDALEANGVERASVSLHVGAGTFRPIDVDDPADHPMHSEIYDVPVETVEAVRRCRARGGAVWAVGTTVVRTLEGVAQTHGELIAGAGETDLFIHPPWSWKIVDGLVTNFHLPRSTLMMLVAALTGYPRLMSAYEVAVREGYRFYSYGDAMLIPPTRSL